MKYSIWAYFTAYFRYRAQVEICLTNDCQIKKAQPKTNSQNIILPGSLLLQRPKMLVVSWIFPVLFLWHTEVFVGFGLSRHRS